VNIVPGVRSLYFWKGALCDEAESTLILKTRRDLLDALGDAIRAAHPYDTPEILVLSVEASDARYAAWVRGSSRA
jgi:periplasmic divalent cation tolerance protein